MGNCEKLDEILRCTSGRIERGNVSLVSLSLRNSIEIVRKELSLNLKLLESCGMRKTGVKVGKVEMREVSKEMSLL